MTPLRQAAPIDPAETIAPLIAHPPLVDMLVIPWLEAQDTRPLVEMGPVEDVMDVDIAYLGAAVAHRRSAREIPDPGLEAKISVGKGSHGAYIHDVARLGIIELLTRR